MKIGIVGVGVVGETLEYGFKRLGHEVAVHDTRWPASNIEAVLDSRIVFVCVPTPSLLGGGCDISIVEDVVRRLAVLAYQGLVAIKSTVVPGTTDMLLQSYGVRIAFCPEFLREKATYTDFYENHEVLITGTISYLDSELLAEAHGHLPKAVVDMAPIEAELAKYFCNALNATRIIFANQFFEICEKLDADYTLIKNTVAKRASVGQHYLDCNHNFRGFGGACLPKDLAALAALVREQKMPAPLFEWLLEQNEKLK
jgi:UDPglucose 6-dehydrogenase